MTDTPKATRIDDLCERLAIEPMDRDLFLADPGSGEGRLFGGRVVAHQAGEAIFNMAASFARPEEGLDHQRAMPKALPPDGLEQWTTLRRRSLGLPEPQEFESPIEVRGIEPAEFEDVRPREPNRQVWIRPHGRLPDDPALHTATLVYATDRTLLSTALRARNGRKPGTEIMGARLDHAVWLHHPIRFDDWLLFTSESPISHAARGLIFEALYRRDGVKLASLAQEARIRVRRPRS